MKASIQANFFLMALIGALAAFAGPASGQSRPSGNMEILREKIKADKKLAVAVHMGLTRAEEKSFWRIYNEYQRDLEKLNKRIGRLLRSYAKDYRNKTLTDAKARKLTDEFLSIEQAEAKLKGSYVPKLNVVLPAKKVARYLQIENKIRALIRYDIAAEVPLVK